MHVRARALVVICLVLAGGCSLSTLLGPSTAERCGRPGHAGKYQHECDPAGRLVACGAGAAAVDGDGRACEVVEGAWYLLACRTGRRATLDVVPCPACAGGTRAVTEDVCVVTPPDAGVPAVAVEKVDPCETCASDELCVVEVDPPMTWCAPTCDPAAEVDQCGRGTMCQALDDTATRGRCEAIRECDVFADNPCGADETCNIDVTPAICVRAVHERKEDEFTFDDPDAVDPPDAG